ncbi:MAG: succinylglutamate desuccinylase/aspartoacylase family protein [Phycisphaerales bacterium]|nr:MAG: succinylglutamate desuccinylase/aspartoacylase family protein [Phycisphaerales bacterium]
MVQQGKRILSYFGTVVLVCLVALQPMSHGQSGPGAPIAQGTRWQTQYYITDSNEPGPDVMIIGGVHGNEQAGARAAEHIRHWKITNGRLVVLPRANVPALNANKRSMPDLPKERSNLNRNFPKNDTDQPKCTLSKAIWDLVRSEEPDWLLDLHEGADFTQVNSDSVGSSIIAAEMPEVGDHARRMLRVLNETVEDANKKFVLKGPPTRGSLARAAADRLNTKTMILETTMKDQRISRRTRQHRIMVHCFLSSLGMVGSDMDVLVGDDKSDDAIRVAIYDAGGVGIKGPRNLEQDLRGIENVVVRRVGVPEISGGALDQFDVVVAPGGSASKQALALGGDGRGAIVEFVRNGGGYAGFCAGAYLASNNYTWSLKIVDAQVIDRKHWKRGAGQVKIELTGQGRAILYDRPGLIGIRYANGPILAPALDPNIPDFEALAHFRTEIAKNGAPEGVMIDTPAIITGRFGKGRVFCSSPHPESTKGLEPLVRRAIQWAAGR